MGDPKELLVSEVWRCDKIPPHKNEKNLKINKEKEQRKEIRKKRNYLERLHNLFA